MSPSACGCHSAHMDDGFEFPLKKHLQILKRRRGNLCHPGVDLAPEPMLEAIIISLPRLPSGLLALSLVNYGNRNLQGGTRPQKFTSGVPSFLDPMKLNVSIDNAWFWQYLSSTERVLNFKTGTEAEPKPDPKPKPQPTDPGYGK